MAGLALSPEIVAAREKWLYRGQQRPEFAEPVGPGEESVWDFPRPPRIEPVSLPLSVVLDGGPPIAETAKGVRVLETAGAPTYYFPPEDVDASELTTEGEVSVCEWKGVATAFSVGSLRGAAWCYQRTFPEFSGIAGWYAFYPGELYCYVGEERVSPQPGGFYGGWVTARLRGPIKGVPGSSGW